jgi:hypothetical protein
MKSIASSVMVSRVAFCVRILCHCLRLPLPLAVALALPYENFLDATIEND